MPVVNKDTIYETFHMDKEKADKVLEQVKAIVHDGNVRRIVVKNAKGETIIEAPLTVGIVGATLVPVWAAIAAIAAIVADCTISLEKRA